MLLLFYKRYRPEQLSDFLSKSKNYNTLFYYKLEEFFESDDIEDKNNLISECRKCNKDGNLKYKKYLENLNNILSFKEECIKKNYIKIDKTSQNKHSVYDCYFTAIKKDNSTWVENQNKNLEYSSKKFNILKLRALAEANKLSEIDDILEKISLKKLGLTPLDMAEIYYDYKINNKATEYLMQIKEPAYLFYVVDLLKNMGEFKKALEIVVTNKDFDMKEAQINEILKRDPKLKEYFEELCAKHKLSI